MTFDRRAVLRSTASLAALTASGALISACDSGSTSASQPDPAEPAATGEAPTPASPAPSASPSPTASASPSAVALPPLPPGLPLEVTNGPRSGKGVALTFHGAGDPAMATALLSAAEQRGAKLTVLAVGNWLDQQPQMAQRILDGGHELGNHSQNHKDMATLSPDQIRAEIEQCAERLQKAQGSIGRWFRASGTEHPNAAIKEQAKAVGYEHVLTFDVDPLDYTDPGGAVVQRRVLSAVKGGSIVTMHMGYRSTIDALPGILDGLNKRGLHAVTVSQLFV